MNMQERTRFSITFGADNEDNRPALNRFIDRVERELSRNTGGMKRVEHSGSWRTDGNDPNPPYDGELIREPAVTLSFVTDIGAERMFDTVKAQIRAVADRTTELDPEAMQWVNVEIEPVKGAHFDLTKPVGGEYGETTDRRSAEKHRPPAPADRIGYDGAAYSTNGPEKRTFEA